MIPAFDEMLTYNNYKNIAKVDSAYASLLHAEYSYCRNNVANIKAKALAVYKMECKKKHSNFPEVNTTDVWFNSWHFL